MLNHNTIEELLRKQILALSAGRSVQEIAENLLALASALRGGKIDDMTVVVTRVTVG